MVLFLGSGVGGKVLLAGPDNILGLNWDDGTVRVSNEASVSWGVDVGVNNGETSSGKVLSAGSLDGGLIDGDNGTVGVGNKAAEVVGIGVAVVGKTVVGQTVVGQTVVGKTVVSIGISVSSEVSSLSSLDLKGLGGGNGAVGVGDELSAGGSDAGEENLQQGKKCFI